MADLDDVNGKEAECPAAITPEVLRGLRAMASALTAPQAEHPDIRAACEWLLSEPAVRNPQLERQKMREIIQEEVSRVLLEGPFISDPRVDYAGIAQSVAERAMRRMPIGRRVLDRGQLRQAAKETHDEYVRNQWLNADRILSAVVNRVLDEIEGKIEDQESSLVALTTKTKDKRMIVPKTSLTLTVSDIRRMFETSSDANVVRDCVRAIGAGVGGVFKSEMKEYPRSKAAERLGGVHNAGCNPRILTKHCDFTIASVEFSQPYYIDGVFIHSGYNVCSEDGWINVMPGACWFMTIADATHGIDCLIEAGGAPRPPYQKDDGVGQRFWKLMEAVRVRAAASAGGREAEEK